MKSRITMNQLSRLAAATAVVACALLAQSPTDGIPSAPPNVWISEVLMNPPGTDGGAEFIELQSALPNTSLDGFYILIVEGETTGAGVVDQRLSLTGMSTGSNGTFLWRDAATSLVPAPDAGTFINVADFSPDMENGSQTYILCHGGAPLLGSDIDTDNDGIVDGTPFAGMTIVDAIGLLDTTVTGDYSYSDDFGFATLGPGLGFDSNAIYRLRTSNGGPAGWTAGTVTLPAGGTPTTHPVYFNSTLYTGWSVAGRPSLQLASTVRHLDAGRPNLCVANVAMSEGNGPGSFNYSVFAPTAAGLTAYSAFSFVLSNGDANAYKGPFFGLWISEFDLALQAAAGAPFVTALDGSGNYDFSIPSGLGLAGFTVYAVVAIPDAGLTRIVAQSPVISLALN